MTCPEWATPHQQKNITNADDMLEIIKLFISKIIGDSHFLLAAQSYGAYLSLGLIKDLGQKISGVLLICPCFETQIKNRSVCKKTIIEKDDYLLSSKNNDTRICDFLEFSAVATKTSFERYLADILPGVEVADKSFLENYQKNGYAFSFDNIINQITFEKPMCIVLGRQDNCVGYSDALSFINNFSRATISILDCAGHNLQIERVFVFNALVNDWLYRTKNGNHKD